MTRHSATPPGDGAPARPEPPIIAMARRAGWVLLSCAVLAMAGARVGPPSWHGGLIAAAVACGLFGMMAIVNVAVVRGLYRGVNHAGEATPPTDRS